MAEAVVSAATTEEVLGNLDSKDFNCQRDYLEEAAHLVVSVQEDMAAVEAFRD